MSFSSSTTDWTRLLEELAKFATCSLTRDQIRGLAPLKTAQQAQDSSAEILECVDVVAGGARPTLESLDFVNLWLERLKKQAVLKTLELKDVRRFCLEAITLRVTLEPFRSPWLKSSFHRLMDAESPLAAIDQIMTADGEIRTDASDTLHQLFRDKQDLERQIRTSLDKLVKSHQMEHLLQDRYVTNREGRWVLPIRSGMQHQMDGIIHDSSQTKQTVFMEPTVVVQLNNQLRRVNSDIDAEIEHLLTQLSKFLTSQAKDFSNSAAVMLACDLRMAQARLTMAIQGSALEFTDKQFVLTDLRHPLLALQKTEGVVANSVELGVGSTAKVLLLSGPNAGGKTVLLKAIGLAAQMARCGLPVACSAGSKAPFFSTVHAVIGDAQSVDAALSTFAAHMRLLTEAAQLSGPSSLILIDEICGSTDPEEGAALARSFVEHFARNNTFAVVTSHLGPLKEGWAQDSGVLAGSMDYDDRTHKPTYQLITGIHGRSLAIRTATQVGVPKDIIDRAYELISPEARARGRALEDVETIRQEVLRLKQELQEESRSLHDRKAQYQKLIERFKKDRDTWMNKAIEQGKAKIDRVVSDIREQNLNRKSPEDIKFELPQIVKSQPRQAPQNADDFAKSFPPGTTVFIPTIGQEGIIQSLPSPRGEVAILSNSMRLSLPWQQIQPSRGGGTSNREVLRRSGHVQFSSSREDRSIDLRGRRVDEALEHLEMQLDRAIQQQEDRVRIIHGHGTESLKKAIRAFLSRSVYVRRWHAGGELQDPSTGVNDGQTIAELADPAE